MENFNRTNDGMEGETVDYLPASRIKDPIHEYITITPYMLAFIDTPQFQRLRNLKQLGTSYFVWPGASHNRFEHCLGVAELARQMVEHLRKHQPSLKIDDRDVRCVTLAGLLHDLGHGPFSHVWDEHFIPQARPNEKWKHESGSKMMIDYTIKANEIDIPQDEVDFIKDLVTGDVRHTKDRQPPEKPFLFEIVANKRNGIDVDKFDYIARDTNALAASCSKEAIRLIQSARVLHEQICFNQKDWITVYRLFLTRWEMHKQYYHHPAAKAIEIMIVDALVAADPYLDISSRIHDPARFTYLSDDILLEVERSTAPELEESRRIITRIRKRQLYRVVDFTWLDWDFANICERNVTPERLGEEMGQLSPYERPSAEDIAVDVAGIHFGRGKKDPMTDVRFYSKRQPDGCFEAGCDSGSHVTPPQCGEVLLRIYSRTDSNIGLLQAAFRNLMQTLRSASDETDSSSTATLLSGPSTPRLNPSPAPGSRKASFSSSDVTKSPYTENRFTKIPRDFKPQTPSRSVSKRLREHDGVKDENLESPTRKRAK